MKMSNYSSYTLLLFLSLSSISLLAQDPIFSFTFDDDLEGWTAVGISDRDGANENALWVHRPDGTASTGAFAPTLPILSVSGGGAVLFDSDGLDNGGDGTNLGGGPVPAPQRGELISPSLDFTGVDKVLLAFNQFYRYFADDASGAEIIRTVGTSSFIEVSGDGGTTFDLFEVNTSEDVGEATDRDDVQVVDISSVAAGQSDVIVKFIWQGDYYFWLIDDIRFYSEIGVDLAIEEYTVPNNFQNHFEVIKNDTFDAEVLIQNNGDIAFDDSLQAVVRVLDSDLNLIWSDTGCFEIMLEPDSSVIWDFDEHYIPGDLALNAENEGYFAVYDVRIKGDTVGETIRPNDNLEFNNFQVRDLSLNKTPGGSGFGFNGEAGGGDAEPYDWANFYSIPETVTENISASQITFEAFTVDENDPLEGKSIVVYLAELPEDVGTPQGVLLSGEGVGVDNFDFSMNLQALIEADMIVGIGSFAFTSDNADSPFFAADIFDFETTEGPAIMKPGRKYLAIVSFPSGSERIVMEVSRDYPLWQLSSMASFPSVNQGGWTVISTGGDSPTTYAENVAVIGIEIALMTAVDDVPLPEAAAKVYPNPANERLTVELGFEAPTDATIFLADMSGRILKVRTLDRALSELQTFDVADYPAGSYIVRIATREGTRTEHVVISH